MADSSPNWQALVARDWHLWDRCQRLISDHFHLTFLPRPPIKSVWRRLWWIVQATHQVVKICHFGIHFSSHYFFNGSNRSVCWFDRCFTCPPLRRLTGTVHHLWQILQSQPAKGLHNFTTDYDSDLVIKHFLGSWKTDLDHDTRFFQLSSFWSDMWEEIIIGCLYLKQVATVNSMVMAPSDFNV